MKPYIRITHGQAIERDHLCELVEGLHYTRVPYVSRQGEYAVRGNLVDVFPFNYRQPVRIDCGPESIDSIRGFLLEEGTPLESYQELVLIPVHSFFAESQKPRKSLFEETILSGALKIRKDDYVVHINYGIGQYVGMKHMNVKGASKKFYVIEYANKEVLYVEAEGPRVLERYIGLEGKKPKLNTLRTKEWERITMRTRLAVRNIARDMLHLQAQRASLQGYRYSADTEWQHQFENEFPYDETPDQLRATEEVKRDMEREKPMDRLLCGDVGYGKTEVAMRAAFKAVMDNKQVAILVPTTILAEQHYLSLKKRVTNYPVSVEVLSRFRTAREQKDIVKRVAEGACDIVVGTHRLLSKDIAFKDLGLVIIDEEQRFGVHHKEKLKQYRSLVDVLTLTATPIPRTLYLSLMGVRDISMIMTPPSIRLPIHTEVRSYDDHFVKEAIQQEIARKGQVYFVHNRVESIERMREHLSELVPEAHFEVAHGQMLPTELEPIMLAFFKGEIDCLISTNIIESGLDVPNANTIIVNRADTFGLSDMYQLRGRVGRFHTQRKAYAYFLVPNRRVITQDAEKRLDAIAQYTELGSGFKIALEDLELRGAGNLLGHEQSGFIYQVGFDFYCRLLHEAIEAEKKGKRSV